MGLLALDIGGANLKAADGRGRAISRPFELWKFPDALPFALGGLIGDFAPADRYVVTMTGELADCYSTKAEGVAAILNAVDVATDGAEVGVYLTDGSLVPAIRARQQPLLAAASNWHALARFAGRYAPHGVGLLIDLGSTTCDLIPLQDGMPVAEGKTDPERLANSELLYTGVQRSPVAAVCPAIPWRGRPCPTAQEMFATTRDAYLLLGDLPEQPDDRGTADGRPATKDHAWDRLARSICADRSLFSLVDATNAAQTICRSQMGLLAAGMREVMARQSGPLKTVILSGQGEFLAQRVLQKAKIQCEVISLSAMHGDHISRCATAHALAVLAMESEPTSGEFTALLAPGPSPGE